MKEKLRVALALALALAAVAPVQGAPLVVGVQSREHPDKPLQAGLGERISVQVQGLAQGLAAVPNGCAGLTLFLDGIPIPGSPPESCVTDAGLVRFLLDRTEDSDAAWHSLLGSPNAFTRKIRLSVGPEGNLAWNTKVHNFELEVIPEIPFYLFFVLLAAALVLVVQLSRRTALLRDPHIVAPEGAQVPYSLARFQLAFWSFLTIAAFVFIWMITEQLDTITGSVLALLGIGSGTAIGASLIAQGKQEGGAKTTATAAPAKSAPRPEPRVQASEGFLRDVLNSPDGISLYRFQMFGWTLVLGIIFCVSVYERLSMPEFSATLLGLMGISSATYLGAKFPEE